jgi:hypothetical protein
MLATRDSGPIGLECVKDLSHCSASWRRQSAHSPSSHLILAHSDARDGVSGRPCSVKASPCIIGAKASNRYLCLRPNQPCHTKLLPQCQNQLDSTEASQHFTSISPLFRRSRGQGQTKIKQAHKIDRPHQSPTTTVQHHVFHPILLQSS